MISFQDYYNEKDSGLLYSIFIGAIIVASFLLGFIANIFGLTNNVFLQWFNQAGLYILLFLVVWFYLRLNKINVVKANGLNVKFKFTDYLVFIMIGAGMFLALLIVNYFYAYFLQEVGHTQSAGIDVNSTATFIAGIFIICMLPAVVEETVFRGAVLKGYSNIFSSGAAIVISAVLFMLMHMNIEQFVNAFICGVILAVLSKKTGSTIPGMVVHFINNFLAILISFIASFSGEVSDGKITLDNDAITSLLIYMVIGLALLTGGYMIIRSRFRKQEKPETDFNASYNENVGRLSKSTAILYALIGIIAAVLFTILIW